MRICTNGILEYLRDQKIADNELISTRGSETMAWD